VVLAVPSAAQAATKTVFMGTPPASQKAFEKADSEVNAYFPNTISVRVGDSVAFAPVGFHTVDLPAKGGKPINPIAPTGKKATGIKDAAGVPFWFNDQPLVGFNPVLFRANFGKTVIHGAKGANSGLPLARRPKPFKVRFSKAGLFRYYCSVHAGMKGSVRVVGKGRGVPSAKADAKRAAKQVTSALKVAKGLLAATKPPANTVSIGADGKGGVHLFAFVPGKLTVPVGTTVRFSMPDRSTETHTATAGPGNPLTQPSSYLGRIVAGFQSPKGDPRADFPSEKPPAVGALTPTLHGNGFWNSGVLDSVPASPLPRSSMVKFAAAGSYDLFCVIHPFMKTTITVQ